MLKLEAFAATRWAPAALVVAFIVVALIGLDRTPPIGYEEVSHSNPAFELAFDGRMAMTVQEGVAHLGDAYAVQPPGHVLAMAAVYRTAGFGMWQTRLAVVAIGAITVLIAYLIARRLTGTALAGLIAGLLLWGDASWLFIVRHARMPDPLGMALAFGSVLLLIRPLGGESLTLRRTAVAGLLAGMALMTAPRTVFMLTAVGVLLLAGGLHDSWRTGFRSASAYAGAALIPIAGWGVYIALNADAFTAQFLPHATGGGSPLAASFAELKRAAPDLVFLLATAAAALALGGRLATRRQPGWRGLSALLVATLVGLVLADWRWEYLTPLLAVGIGSLCASALLAHKRSTITAVVVLGLVAIAATAAPGARALVAIAQWDARSPGLLSEQISAYVSRDCTLAGPAYAYYAAHDLGCEFRFSSFRLQFPDASEEVAAYREALAEWEPDYLILWRNETLDDLLPAASSAHYSQVGGIGTVPAANLLVDLLDRVTGTASPYEGRVYERTTATPRTSS